MMQWFKRVQARAHLSRPVLFALLAVVLCMWGFSAVAEDTGERGILVCFDSALESRRVPRIRSGLVAMATAAPISRQTRALPMARRSLTRLSAAIVLDKISRPGALFIFLLC